ncbi:MAG: DUF418 domain-containing protein [Phycisphaerales bacterium]|nr:DUF418 domain-containing protein [Phycisphaerales bacterium]
MTDLGAAPLAPVGEGERIVALDVLRGAALFGIVMANLPFFSLPFLQVVGGPTTERLAPWDAAAWLLVQSLVNYKFISLFSLLFGAGFMVQAARAASAGRSVAPTYLRRLLVLGLIGLVHALLLWYGDILFIYAVLGTVLLLVRNLSPRGLVILAVVLLAVAFALATGVAVLEAAFASTANGTAATAESSEAELALRGVEALRASGGDPATPVWVAGETAAYREGPFVDALVFRAVTWLYTILSAVFGFGWHVLALFVLGAAMMKTGFFGREQRSRQVRFARIGIAIGLPIELGASILMLSQGQATGWLHAAATPLHAVGSVVLCLGYAGLIAAWANRDRRPAGVGVLSSLGRMALTCYLLQTVLATALFYWWGLGWFGSLGRASMILVAIGIYVAEAAFAMLWLRRFRMGPAEWVWRTLTYLHPPALRRAVASATV